MIFRPLSDHFPKISEDFPKLLRRPDERWRSFSENFRKFPKMSEDFRRLPRTFGGDPKMFRWYTNEFKYNLRDKRDITEIIDIFTCEDIISSHVRISYRFYQFVTTRYTTDFYIINTINTHPTKRAMRISMHVVKTIYSAAMWCPFTGLIMS